MKTTPPPGTHKLRLKVPPNVLKIIRDPYVIFSVFMGVLLMVFTMHYRVNPVEGSVVNESIRDTPFHYLLLVTTMPAWIAGAVIEELVLGWVHRDWEDWFVVIPLIFIIQIALYMIFGLTLRLIHRVIIRMFSRADDGRSLQD